MPWTARLGVLIILAYAVVAVFANLIAPYGETQIVGAPFQPWGGAFLLGTDSLGRDMLSRMIYGARNTVGIALAINVCAFIVGGLLGMLAAVLRGWIDQVLGRAVDAVMALPQLVLALLLLAIFGNSIPVLISIVALLDATRVFRLTRAVAMNVAVMEFVEVARLRGEGLWWCIRREILPNIMTPLLAEFGIRFCYVFLFISGLSFLGLGLQPPTADWGSMVRDNAALISFGDFLPLLPAAAIAVLTVSVNFVVDWFVHQSSGLKE